MTTTHSTPIGAKQKIVHEVRELLAIFVYLAVFFLVFKFYTQLMLEQYGIAYFAYGLTILKALVLAKIILTADMLHIGEHFEERSLIIPTVYKTIAFAIFTLIFEILEHIIIGAFHGKGLSEVIAEIADKGWPHLAGMTLVVFVAFLPFFAFRETDRVLGEEKLIALFFKRARGISRQ